MDKQYSNSSYVSTGLATSLFLLGAIILFCLLMDPYRLYPAISQYGPEKSIDLLYHLRLHKPYRIEQLQPAHLIVGSSRAARLPTQNYQPLNGTAYNAALPGATLLELRRAVEHAHAVNPLASLIIGLDYYMFQPEQPGTAKLHIDTRWQHHQPSSMQKIRHGFQHVEDYWRSLLSVDAVADSWRTLQQDATSIQLYQGDGTWDIGAGELTPAWLYSALANQIYRDFRESSDRFDTLQLRQLLAFAQREGIEVKLLLTPMQGLLLQSVYIAGGWDHYLQWQRELVNLVAQADTGAKIFGLEDNAVLVLESPENTDPLFRDGIHFTRRAGAAIMNCLTGPCESPLQPTQLNNQNVDLYLQQVDKLRVEYLRSNPRDQNRLRRWLRQSIR